METASPLSLSPPPIQSAQASATIRRHHTISTATRSSRTSNKAVITEEPQEWNEGDEEEEWTAPLAQTLSIGTVGEQKGLHRQASLPAGYTRELRHVRSSAHVGSRVNSLSAITAEHVEEAADDEDWEQEIPWNRGDEEQARNPPIATAHVTRPVVQRGQTMHGLSPSPISSAFTPPHPNSPPPPSAGANIRRHQSLTYGTANSNPAPRLVRAVTGSRRVGRAQEALALPRTASPVEDGDEDSTPSSPVARAVWGDTSGGYNSPSKNMWKEDLVDDVSKALDALEMQTSDRTGSQYQLGYNRSLDTPPSSTPPRLGQSLGFGSGQDLPRSSYAQQSSTQGLYLTTSGQNQQSQIRGPVSASPFVPQVGRRQSQTSESSYTSDVHRAHTLPEASSKGSNNFIGPNGYGGNQATFGYNQLYSNTFMDPSISMNLSLPGYNSLGVNSGLGVGMALPYGSLENDALRAGNMMNSMGPSTTENSFASNGGTRSKELEPTITSPIDVQALIQQKGYNPVAFDTRPQDDRFFVIKSYTEEDVHKSLKYEIWSSTDPGNKRLDKAFRENAGRGPIYLFFSVNGSGHFCGVAEMLTPVDYTRTSTVWAQDKWKGVFKVRWIFVRDIPNAVLRGIRLENTQERKPVTNSRDTQELLKDAGYEMLRIFLTHAAKTSLLQDLSYYENKSLNRDGESTQPTSPQRHKKNQQQQTQRDQLQRGQVYYPHRQQSPPQFYSAEARAEENFTLLQQRQQQQQQLLQLQQIQQLQGLHSPSLRPRDNGLATTPYDIQNQMNSGYFSSL